MPTYKITTPGFSPVLNKYMDNTLYVEAEKCPTKVQITKILHTKCEKDPSDTRWGECLKTIAKMPFPKDSVFYNMTLDKIDGHLISIRVGKLDVDKVQ